jgi:O-antigen ligase
MTLLTSASRNPSKLLAFFVVVAVLAFAALAGRQPSVRYLFPIIAVLGVLLLVRRPGMGLIALAGLSFTVPITFGTGTGVPLTPPVFLIPAVALAWLAHGLRSRSLRLPASPTTLPLLLFAGSGFLSLLLGTVYWDPLVPRPGNLLLVQLGQLGIYCLSALIFLLAGELGRDIRWLRLAVWVFLALAAEVVLEHYLPPLRRIIGWSGQELANRSMFWIWFPALATGQLLFNRRLSRPARLGLLALLLSAAYTIWVRWDFWISGWAPFTIAVLVVICLWVWRRSRAAAGILVLAFIVLAIVLYPALFAYAGGEEEAVNSWGGRQVLYQAVLDMANTHPIFGLGPVAYRQYGFQQWLSTGLDRALYLRPLISSHNNYIDIYAQMGLVGLGLFLWFLVAVGRLGWRLRSRCQSDFAEGYVYGALGGMAGSLAAMMLADWFLPFVYNVGFAGFRTSALAWMFLGGLAALDQTSGSMGPQGDSGD